MARSQSAKPSELDTIQHGPNSVQAAGIERPRHHVRFAQIHGVGYTNQFLFNIFVRRSPSNHQNTASQESWHFSRDAPHTHPWQ